MAGGLCSCVCTCTCVRVCVCWELWWFKCQLFKPPHTLYPDSLHPQQAIHETHQLTLRHTHTHTSVRIKHWMTNEWKKRRVSLGQRLADQSTDWKQIARYSDKSSKHKRQIFGGSHTWGFADLHQLNVLDKTGNFKVPTWKIFWHFLTEWLNKWFPHRRFCIGGMICVQSKTIFKFPLKFPGKNHLIISWIKRHKHSLTTYWIWIWK